MPSINAVNGPKLPTDQLQKPTRFHADYFDFERQPMGSPCELRLTEHDFKNGTCNPYKTDIANKRPQEYRWIAGIPAAPALASREYKYRMSKYPHKTWSVEEKMELRLQWVWKPA